MAKQNSNKICITSKSGRSINYVKIADKEIEKTRKDVEKIEKEIQNIQCKMRLLL